jgi:hypothetical protein
MINLTFSRRPDELELGSGHGNVRCGLWQIMDLHREWSNAVGTDSSSLCSHNLLLFPLGWFRAVGTTMRLFCGVALVVLSLMIYYYLAWAPLCVRPVVLLRPCVSGQLNGSCFVDDDLDSRCTRGLVRLYSLYYHSLPRTGPYRIVLD